MGEIKNRLSGEWLDIDKLVLYGWGNVGKKCFNKFNKDFTIVSIIDNDPDKQGEFQGIPIMDEKASLEILQSNKVVVLTGGKVYRNIANSLNKIGLREYLDFCSVELFIAEWYWKKRGENCLLEVHTAVTMQCTFNCKNCNMFVPYYRDKIHYSIDELKQMYDLFFTYVDYVFCIALLGGEPLITPVTGEIINYLGEKYLDKIGKINIISNGSVMPDNKTIEVMRKNNVLVYISDYSATISYKEKLLEIVENLRSNDIECIVRNSDEWKDFGFPTKPLNGCKNIREHMDVCAPLFHGLNDNKFYYCHVAWSAEKAGLYKLKNCDYIDLEKLDVSEKRKVTQHALGEIREEYVSLCKVCGGCGEDNIKNVKAAIQME